MERPLKPYIHDVRAFTSFSISAVGEIGRAAVVRVAYSRNGTTGASAGTAAEVYFSSTRTLGVEQVRVSVHTSGVEAFRLSAVRAPGTHRLVLLRITMIYDAGAIDRERDRNLGLALLCSFFGLRADYDFDGAENSLRFHLARGAGLPVRSIGDSWFFCDRGYGRWCQVFLGNLREQLRSAFLAGASDS